MADIINAPTYEQIATILSHLATNYSNMAMAFYDIFDNTTPMYVEIQMYNEKGELETHTIPNRAMDRQYRISKNGNPQGEESAPKGTIYQDLANGTLFIKEDESSNNGWSRITTDHYLSTFFSKGNGSPEGVVDANKGVLYVDESESSLYIKGTPTGTKGWTLISANTQVFADVNFSNISELGEGKIVQIANGNAEESISSESGDFRYPSSKCVYDIKVALEDEIETNKDKIAQLEINKEDVTNKVTEISSESTEVQYPSAKCVYDAIESSKVNKSLVSGLSRTSYKEILVDETGLANVIVEDEYKSYIVNVAEETTLILSSDIASEDNELLEFNLVINMEKLNSIIFNSANLYWSNGVQPELNETGLYMFKIQSIDKGTTWLGSQQGHWNIHPEEIGK